MIPTLLKEENGQIVSVEDRPMGSPDDLQRALEYIRSNNGTDLHADIIVMSIGMKNCTEELRKQLYRMAENKVLISAAGTVLLILSATLSL